MSDLTFVSSDTAPSIYGTLAINGTPIDLTGAMGVQFQMRPVADRRLWVDGAAVVESATLGLVRYDWEPGDLATTGDYAARWQITFGDGTIQHTEPENTITVAPA